MAVAPGGCLGSWLAAEACSLQLEACSFLVAGTSYPFTFLHVVLGDGLELFAARQKHFLHAAEPVRMAFGIIIASKEGMIPRVDRQLNALGGNHISPGTTTQHAAHTTVGEEAEGIAPTYRTNRKR